MAYTTIDKPSDYFNTKLYTGTGSSNSVTGVGFQPDWVWIKSRSDAQSNNIFDSVRGQGKLIFTDANSAEATVTNRLTAFNSDGFTVVSDNAVNGSSKTYASWNWKAGTSFTNDASSTGIGTIDSTGSVSSDSGFSIIKYTGTGSAGTIAHGLGKKPDWIIVKAYQGGQQWAVQHAALGATKGIRINTTAAAYTSSTRWNNTEPTSSVFSVGNEAEVNTNTEDHIAYCFAEKKGYSKFGSYTGNGNADGTFVYTGFKPAITITKRTDSTSDWQLNDDKRDPFNPSNKLLLPNTSGAEATSSSYNMDFLSNGFKFRNTLNNQNASGSYIYMAFAENPFVTSSGVPATAR